MKKALLILTVIFSVLQTSCHVFDTWEQEEDVKIYFQDPNLLVMKGGMAYFQLKIEPEEARGNMGVDYVVSNKSIGKIYSGDRKGVTMIGADEGACIITAWLGDAKAEAVLTVTKLDD